MLTMDPKLAAEAKRRVCIAWTMALTIKPNDSKEDQLKLAESLLNNCTTDELIRRILELKWETPVWWKGSREQWLHHIGKEDDGLQETAR